MNTSEFSQTFRSPLFVVTCGENVVCELCPNNCVIKTGGFGKCGVRGNKGGKGIIPFYGFVSSLAVDPIEKKPLYHFKPGSKILSLGFAGCNLRCPFCQNWHISQNTDVSGKWHKPNEIIYAALHNNTPSIAYTYSESLVHIEYLLDCMMLARRHGIANVLVTNGCVNYKAAVKILKFADAVNVDLKCYCADTYKNCLGGDLQAVLTFIELAQKMNVHTEITTLVVPDLNDSGKELNAAADFIASLNKDIPWHLSAYHPDYRWNAPPTNPDFLLRAANEAKGKLSFVYTGNITANNDTLCTICGAALVKRNGYNADTSGITSGNCTICGKTPQIVF
ncbi:MAG: AmmeMemoRadiSam system radical SAM enzyme [Treponema sp.]|nr:AmmeMemoRadiSam system radical SAM enzyme [Treponema sp.]